MVTSSHTDISVSFSPQVQYMSTSNLSLSLSLCFSFSILNHGLMVPILIRLAKTETIIPFQRAHIISCNVSSSNTSYKSTQKINTHTHIQISMQLLHCRPHYDRQTKRHQRIFTHHLKPLSSSLPASIQTGSPVL